MNIYKIDIVKTYKASENATKFLRQSRLMTAPSDGLCGIEFSKSDNLHLNSDSIFIFMCSSSSIEIGQLYAIAGITNRVGICQYVREYSSLSQIEKRGIAGAYKKGCSCDVSHDFQIKSQFYNQISIFKQINLCMSNEGCDSPSNACDWSHHNHCETDLGTCVPIRNPRIPSKPAKCQWRRTQLYQRCINDP